ncbi:MAG: M14 family murein peptide amidase A [Phycisphaerae bacterium]|nr:M14 family murein peptide amidase A [Phycisphaerae bacterium]
MVTTLTSALLMYGCAALQPPGDPENRQTMPDRPRREILGTSRLGRPIEIEYFGAGSSAVLILGGIHGDEVTSVDLTRKLMARLRERPELTAGKTVAIIEVANPDGYWRRTRTNARGVDLNRNFPARNYRPGGPRGYNAASAPASEPETRAILAAIAELKPSLIISIHSIRGGRECNNYDGPAEPVARAMHAHNGYPVTATIGYPTPGSLGSYAGIDLQIPTVTLELPRNQSGDEAWRVNEPALLAAIRW